LKLEVLVVAEEEKVLLREGLEAAAAVELEEQMMAMVAEVLLRAEEVVVLQAVLERMSLEEAAVVEGLQKEPVLRMPAAAEEEPEPELRELEQPKLGPAEEKLEAAWL
jgi:hypothetical protein